MCECLKGGNSNICGFWSNKAPCLVARELFAAASGPDKTGKSPTAVDSDPRVYIIGGNDENGESLQSCEKYNPNNDEWEFIADLPEPLGNCDGTFVPDYSKGFVEVLGYIYVVGDNKSLIYRYNIKQDKWDTFPIPFKVSNASIQYLDDIGGPLSALFQAISGINLPPCSDGTILWVVGGDGTEKETWFVNTTVGGEINGDWVKGPDLPLLRFQPLIGRTFWRDAGITSFGVSNCASIVVAGGNDSYGEPTDDVQILVRINCDWAWVTLNNNPTQLPDQIFKLSIPVASGSFGTEQWPETLVTGGRALLFGGVPAIVNSGSTQYAQLRFIEGRYQDWPNNHNTRNKKSFWNTSTSMPGQRINFRSLPLSQENSSTFGGNRVSRFLSVGGRDENGVLKRAQLFELPVPPAFLILQSPSSNSKRSKCSKQKHSDKHPDKYQRHHKCRCFKSHK